MRYEKNRKILGIDEYLFMKFLKFMILPLIIISLIIIIVVVDKLSKKEKAESPNETLPAVSETSAEDAVKEAGDEITDTDIINSLQALIERYYTAKADGDVVGLYEIFGAADTQDAEGISQRIQDEAKIYERFEDVTIYAYQGVEADSYIVFTSSKIKFTDIDTMVPSFNRACIYRTQDGNYYMKQSYTLSDEETALVNSLSKSERIETIESNMRTELAQVLLGNAELSTLYQDLLGIEAKSESTENVEGTEEEIAVEDAVVNIGGQTGETIESISDSQIDGQESTNTQETNESTESVSE